MNIRFLGALQTKTLCSATVLSLLLFALSQFAFAAVLIPVEDVDGEIFDVDQSRLLYLHDDGRLRIRDRLTATDVVIPSTGRRTPMYGYLAPRGAIFQADNGVLDSGIYEWANGRLANLGNPNSDTSLEVNGRYAIWSVGDILIRRDLRSGINTTIASNAGNWFNDVTRDGRVVYWTGFTGPGHTGPTDYNIFWYDNGVTTRLTADGYYYNVYPTTDGARVVFAKSEPCCARDQLHRITLIEDGIEKPLGPWGITDVSWPRDYQLNSGWVAYAMRPNRSQGKALWLRAPDGQTRQLATNIAHIEHVSPDGQVTWVDDQSARYLWAGTSAISLGINAWPFGRSVWIDGTWYLIREGILYEMDLSRDSRGRDNDVTVLSDVNGNGTADVVVMSVETGGKPVMTVRDGISKALIRELEFEISGKVPVGVTGVSDLNGNGSPEVALLMIKADGRGRVHIKDAATGQWIGKVNALNPNWQALAITSLDLDGDGVSEVAVLGQRDDGAAVATQIIDTRTGRQENWIDFPASIRYVDVTSLPDSNGNGYPEIGALYAVEDGRLRVVVKDGATDALINVVNFDAPRKSPLGLTSLADVNGNGAAEVAVLLARGNGRGRLWVKDALNGEWISRVNAFNSNWQTLAISSEDSGRSGASLNVSVLGVHDDGSRVAVQIINPLSGAQANWISFRRP